MRFLLKHKKEIMFITILFATLFAFPVLAAPTSGCGVFGTTTTKYIKLANNILRIGGPLLVIALGIMDFLKILLSGEEKVYKEAILRFIKRLIALVALLLLPYILFFILKISGVLKMYGISNQDIFCVLGF